MRKLVIIVSICGFSSGCASTGHLSSIQVGEPKVRTFKYCPLPSDEIDEYVLLDGIARSIERASAYGPLKSVKTGIDVNRIKGLEVKLDVNKGNFSYLHRQSIKIDANSGAGRQSSFSGLSEIKTQKNGECSLITVSSPKEFSINIQKTILFEEIQLIGEPNELALDSKNSIEKSDGIVGIVRDDNIQGKIYLKEKPEDVSTMVWVKEKQRTNEDGVSSYFLKQLNIDEGVSFKSGRSNQQNVKFRILPFKDGTLIEYEAKYYYFNTYRPDGSVSSPSEKDMEKIRSNIEGFIHSIQES